MTRSPQNRASSPWSRASVVLAASAALGDAAQAQAIEQAVLKAAVPTPHQRFGDAIAVDDDLLVVGGKGDNGYSGSEGLAWVYRWDPVATEWQFETTLASSAPEANGAFGSAVAIHGDVIAITARYEDSTNAVDSGAVHLFRGGRAIGGTWTHQQRLTSTTATFNEEFGFSLALHDDVLLVGVPLANTVKGYDSGQVHVFEYDGVGQVWNESAPLLDPDGSNYDYAGKCVAFDGTTALIGTPGEADGSGLGNRGTVSIWTMGASTWTHTRELLSPSPLNGEQFGFAVALDGVDMIVGSPGWSGSSGKAFCGGIHFFTLRNGIWQPSGTHENPDPWVLEAYGSSVALKGKIALAGASSDNQAASYRKGKFNKGWFFDQELSASNAAFEDGFGTALAIGNGQLLVSAFGIDLPFLQDHGGIYLFDSDEINLAITPTQPNPGETMSLVAYDGLANDPILLVVDEIDDVPVWIELIYSTFGANHRFELDIDAENPLFGLNVGVRALKLSPTGPVVISERVNVDI